MSRIFSVGFSGAVPVYTSDDVALTVGSLEYNRLITDMEKQSRIPAILGADPRLTCNVRVPLVLHKNQVCLRTAEA